MSVTNRALRNRIDRIIAKWRPIFGLDAWLLDIRYDEKTDLANCFAKPRYEEAVVNFNLPRIRAELPNTMAALEELVCHELTHCLCWYANETTVSRIARVILRAKYG